MRNSVEDGDQKVKVLGKGKLETACARDKEKLRKKTENHHGRREEGESDLRDVKKVTPGRTRREKERDGQGGKKTR